MITTHFDVSSVSNWMLFSLVIGGVVSFAALAAHDAQRAANHSVRFVWFGAIVATVVLSFAAPARRVSAPTRIPMPTATTTSATTPSLPRSPSVTVRLTRAADVVMIPIETALQFAQTRVSRLPMPWHVAIASLWLIGTTVTIGIFVASYARIRRLMRRWPVQRIDDIRARIAPSAGPAVIGLAPSEIILPSWLLSRPIEEQRLVVAHEREHVNARDPWLLVLACAAVALMPWNPALWFALSRLRLAIEVDCDRRVLGHGVATEAYGSLLIDLSVQRADVPSAMPAYSMPAFSCNGSYLERRLVAMTSRPSRFASSRRMVGGLLAAAALMAACESKLPTSAEIATMDVAGAQKQAGLVALADDGKSVYIVDGKPASAEVAKKILAEQIATITVRRGAGDSGVVSIRTNRAAGADGDVALTLSQKQAAELAAHGGMKIRARSLTITADTTRGASTIGRKFDGLLIIDGTISDSKELDTLSPDRIESVEVMKGAAAQAAYSDPRAANGVIKVTTKVKK